LASASSIPAGFSSALDLRSTTIKVGGNLQGRVAIRDTGRTNVRVLTAQPVEVVIIKPGTRRVVGVYAGGIGGTAFGGSLHPGQSQSVRIVGGTARCDGGIGSALPAGHYDAVAEVSGVGVDGESGTHGVPPPTYFTPVVPIRIVPAWRAGASNV
jgi:hypothetical protein